jgi:putative flippase GtrA
MPPRRAPGQFIRFTLVGGIGFVVDAGLLRLLLVLGLGYYGGRVVSFLAAATTTWLLNRSFTFRRESSAVGHPAGEWVAYLGVMVIGGAVNYGTYAAAIELSELVRRHPELGVALGSLAGLCINFWSAKLMIFERKSRP